MNTMEKSWLDRFSFALGSVTIASPYMAVPTASGGRIPLRTYHI